MESKAPIVVDKAQDLEPKYFAAIHDIMASTPNRARFLIFCPDVQQCVRLANRMTGKTCILSSGHTEIDPTAKFFISTSVSDVGLTIPSVDVVITLDIDRAITLNHDGTSTAGYSRLTSEAIHQRRGRTGRTNNGTFHVLNVLGAFGTTVLLKPPATPIHLLTEWFSMGVKASTIAQFRPDLLLALTGFHGKGGEYDSVLTRSEADQTVDKIARHLEVFLDNAHIDAGMRQFSSTLSTSDGSEVANLEISSTGRFFRTSLPDIWSNVALAIKGGILASWQEFGPNVEHSGPGEGQVPSFTEQAVSNALIAKALHDTIVLGVHDADSDMDDETSSMAGSAGGGHHSPLLFNQDF